MSLRYITNPLKVGTCFVGYMQIPDTKDQSVKDDIIKAITIQLPTIDFKKIPCQTCDGVSVM